MEYIADMLRTLSWIAAILKFGLFRGRNEGYITPSSPMEVLEEKQQVPEQKHVESTGEEIISAP